MQSFQPDDSDSETEDNGRDNESTASSGGIVPVSNESRELLRYSDLTIMEDFLKNIGWTPVKELQVIMDIIETTDNDNVKLRALKQLADRRNKVIENSGLVVRATKVQQDSEGNKTVFSADVLTSAFPKQKRSSNVPYKSIESTQVTESQRASTDPSVPVQSSGTTVISTDSGAALHKPPVGTGGPDSIEPEVRGSREVPCRDTDEDDD